MSGDKRKQGPLDAFVTVTKKPLITSSSSEQTERDQPAIVSLEVAQPIRAESEETEHNVSSDVVITCARQNIALRGHRGEDIVSIREHIDAVETSSGSNFISRLKQRIDAGDHLLQSHLEKGPRNSTYISPSTQNEIIELIYEHILSSILGRVGPTTLYSIIVDGTTDSSNIEQLCLLIRYVDPHSNEIREDFLAFLPTTSSTSEVIAGHILSCLKRFKLSPNYCIWQAYDGAPCMSGIFNGCQTVIKRFCPDAEYMHCSSHALNLALIDSCTSHFIRNMFGIIKSIITFFNDSPKRSNALKYEIERTDNDYLILTKKKRLLTLCETRWVERNVAIETFLELYTPISNTLDFLRIQGDSSSQQLYHPGGLDNIPKNRETVPFQAEIVYPQKGKTKHFIKNKLLSKQSFIKNRET
ncbi:unnamed protein product [Rotaria magnacalcarata]|uniref:DUF4371 domain-containing protein n=2 Tax=Rotaria magnacalcarata TaxID=392030 RepID=A0A816XZN0_9BILA|nr:unnamed protein product [Rotaria magnacalcarata]